MVAHSSHFFPVIVWNRDYLGRGLGSGSIYLHFVLDRNSSKAWKGPGL